MLDILEGPIRRELHGPGLIDEVMGTRNSKNEELNHGYILHVGERQFDVGRPQFDAAPQDGIVRLYLLPDSDRIVNLERVA